MKTTTKRAARKSSLTHRILVGSEASKSHIRAESPQGKSRIFDSIYPHWLKWHPSSLSRNNTSSAKVLPCSTQRGRVAGCVGCRNVQRNRLQGCSGTQFCLKQHDFSVWRSAEFFIVENS